MPTAPPADRRLSGWTLVFDLDGTLVDSAPDLLAALNHTLGLEGLAPVELAAIRTMIGRGAKVMIAQGLAYNGAPNEPSRVDALWPVFLDHYEANIARHTALFEGAGAALDELATLGARLAVCTNKTQALSDRLLGELGEAERFHAIVGADAAPARKPDGRHVLHAVEQAGGRADRAMMIGDSRTDERAARNAGLPFLFVPFGYESEPAERIDCDAVVADYSQMVSRILSLAV